MSLYCRNYCPPNEQVRLLPSLVISSALLHCALKMRKKSRLSSFKNRQSAYHVARAKGRKEKRCKESASFVKEMVQTTTESDTSMAAYTFSSTKSDHPPSSECPDNDDNFIGFDVAPWKPALRVLSVFDGMASTLHILDSLNLSVEVYYSCEIDEKALKLQRYIFGNRITQLGSVEEISQEMLDQLSPINFLIGGSPCSDLSLVNPRRRGLHGQGSTGQLFFNYVNILRYLKEKAMSSGHPFFWVFENTAHLERETLMDMNRNLGCEPRTLCLSQFQPMRRKRNIWGNVLGEVSNYSDVMCCRQVQDHLSYGRVAKVDIVPTLTTCSSSQRSACRELPVREDGSESSLYITELESLMGYPVHFTDGPNLSVSDRRKLLGKSFAVPVFQYVLLPLKDHFRESTVEHKNNVGPSMS